MKPHKIIPALVVCVLPLTACSKKQPPAPQAYEVSGVKVEMPKLQATFAAAQPELSGEVNTAASMIRYGQYERAMQALDHLLSNPALNDAQKKIVTDVLDQLKQVVLKVGPSR